MTPEDVQLYYQIATSGRRDLAIAPDARTGFEMAMLRMLAFRPDDGAPAARAAQRPAGTSQPAAAPRTNVAAPERAPAAAATHQPMDVVPPRQAPAARVDAPVAVAPTPVIALWLWTKKACRIGKA
jgi:DNA polymerase-3 subunit gamma/tau